MKRQRLNKNVPSLKETFAAFKGFKPGESRQSIVTAMLRNAARKLQTPDPRPFYSMREVGTHFSVPLRTVALAYESLDMEGLLHRIRGSQTMLAGKKTSTSQPVNAIVGLPIWLTSMIISPFECLLQMELDERLRARGFVADSIFYRTGEECEPDFASRLLRHNLDMLIWQSPHPLSTHVLMSLRERGVRLVLLQSAESPLRVAARNYLFDWQPAYGTMAAEWKQAGFRLVVIPEPSHLMALRALRVLKPMLESKGFEVRVVNATEACVQAEFPSDAEPGTAVLAFIDLETADYFCNSYPDVVERVASRARLAFCRGAVRVPRLTARRVQIDLVQLNPATLAAGVVDDLCDPKLTHEGTRKTFQAEYQAQKLLLSLPDQAFGSMQYHSYI